jgi:hypothetical protein
MITFESPSLSTLNQIYSSTFGSSRLKRIEIPKSVEIFCSEGFHGCKSLETIAFESLSIVDQIESSVDQLPPSL